MDEQQAATNTHASKFPHREQVDTRWGDHINEERRAELRAILDNWNVLDAERGDRRGPFAHVVLSGADVFWLAMQSNDTLEWAVPNLHLEEANLFRAHLEGAHLEGAHLEGAFMRAAFLEGAHLDGTHAEGADLTTAQLKDANLKGAQLKEAALHHVNLEGASLRQAQLNGATLKYAHLEGADLSGAILEGTDLRESRLNYRTVLNGAILDDMTKLGDMQWGGVGVVNLTQIDWERVSRLGDEHGVGPSFAAYVHAAIVRAYRQLAAQLRAQGMNEVADRFTYRAQIRQRWAHLHGLLYDWRYPLRWPGHLVRYLGSLFLAVLAGYGYRPGRTFSWYVLTVLSFMGGYWLVTHGVPLFGLTEPSGTQPLHWYEALVLSLASFHGRGFFPQGINLGDPVAILAASEAVIGLFIEISFIATFTQRYFGGK